LFWQDRQEFCRGMSGGVAYVYNEDGSFNDKCNMSMVLFDRLERDDESRIHDMLKDHIKYTNSR